MRSFGGFNPEQAAASQEEGGVPLLLRRLEKRVEATRAEAIQETDFIDLYGSKVVNDDRAEVERLEEAYRNTQENDREQQSNVVWGHAVEALLHDQINHNKFLGEGAVGIKTSRFDDYKNGVDELVVFSRPEGVSHLGLSIDFTFGNPDRKVGRIVDKLRRGEETVVKYCKVNVPGWKSRGELATPKVVVSVSRAGLREALALWAEGAQDKLAGHPLQMLLLRQIADQLDVYKQFAPPTIQAYFEAAGRTVDSLIKERREAGVQMGALRNDTSHLLLMKTLNGLLDKNSAQKVELES